MRYTGVCVGSSSISLYDGTRGLNRPHHGNPRKLLEEILPAYLENGNIIVTGRKAKKLLNLPQISEVEASEIAYRDLRKKYGETEAIVSAGGENFILYKLNDKGIITGIFTGSKCASGTGEFFLQQLKRMGIDLEYANRVEPDGYYELSSRCTVFCKSDCTHALNKGTPKELVLNGLGKVMAEKILELAHKSRVRKIMLVGGTTRNNLMVRHLREYLNVLIPDEALFFEAYGAQKWGSASKKSFFIPAHIFNEVNSSFSTHEPLRKYLHMVEFKDMSFARVDDGDVCILGVDVGSTTTKAVLMRVRDNAILAGSYLRTLGDPIKAARTCYREILEAVGDVNVEIVGLGVTGSGRKIVGLHARTDAVYNEIMAHARAARHFDPTVDTIFEIGGQDAKYTYLVNGVPADYAMNEACSAGTGSFLEEGAKESLEVHYTEIGELALKSEKPPNFSDQCAAFINSDVKTAIHEGISKEDICAGLVYSICMNYLNRVKGNRPVGKKVIMQGGVCYNRAVPVAMAALTGKRIVVPPHPGLMGAYGVALMVKDGLEEKTLRRKKFDLRELASREVVYERTFVCPGGRERCDRKCEIRIINIDGKKYPFGGACNKYENVVRHLAIDAKKYNYVRKREELIFHSTPQENESRIITVGINRSLAMTTLFPIFKRFFEQLGFKIIVPEVSDKRGWERKNAEFCFPVEMSHGYMYDLLKRNPDVIFLPRIRGMKVENSRNYNVFCPFVQSEPDYLKAAFPDLKQRNLLELQFDFSQGFEKEKDKFKKMAVMLGRDPQEGEEAYAEAVKEYLEIRERIKKLGDQFLEMVNREKFGVVLFGRSYNAFTSHANMGIPEKFATRGIPIINFDALPYEKEEGYPNMYWAWGEMIIKAARFVKKHPKLFGVYITNFSCGPDSFIISYFRSIMGTKPSLILELDSHTADAGIETRVEAFIDVVESFLKRGVPENIVKVRRPTIVLEGRKLKIHTSDGRKLPMAHKDVRLVFPTMSEFGAQCLAAAIRYFGVETEVCPRPDVETFKLGRGNSLSKECLPLQLTLGSLVRYLDENGNDGKITLYFMPETMGPCRFGQYRVFMELWLEKNGINNVALLSLNSENAYAGMGFHFKLRAWVAVIVADVFVDVENAIKTLAADRKEAERIVEGVKEKILYSLANDSIPTFFMKLRRSMKLLEAIEKKAKYETTPKVLITGEIYVRKDEFSRKGLEDIFAENGIITHISPVHEWIYYTDYLFLNRYTSPNSTRLERLYKKLEVMVKRYIERKIKEIFAKSGVYQPHLVDVEHTIKAAEKYLNPSLTGEAILTVGTAISEVGERYDGVISIGPFGCMPSRIAEAIIKHGIEEMKKTSRGLMKNIFQDIGDVPVIFIESDGNPFTPIIENRIEAFMVQVKRLREYKNSVIYQTS